LAFLAVGDRVASHGRWGGLMGCVPGGALWVTGGLGDFWVKGVAPGGGGGTLRLSFKIGGTRVPQWMMNMLSTNMPAAPLATFTRHDGMLEVVEVLHEDGGSKRMCELGICEGKRLRVVSQGDPAIVAIGDSRFALAAELLARVFVRPVE